jgi:DnaJ like chaperone protein
MSWLGKALGAAIGRAALGPWGAIIGAALGHQYDRGGSSPGGGRRVQERFFATTFEVMGYIAKVDGRVSEEEIDAARRIMQAMRLSPEEVQLAIAHFNEGKRADYALEQNLADLAAVLGPRHELAGAFVDIQVRAAAGAGAIDSNKRVLLGYVAEVMGFERGEIARIEAALGAGRQGTPKMSRESSLADAYRTLGVAPTASDAEVKTAYRRLMNQHHPDKLVSKGLPESMIDLAEKRTQQIRAAYDRIKDERGFK